MKRKKTVWILAGSTVFLFYFGISIFLLSVHFGEQTNDPDKYWFLGFLTMLAILMLSFLFGCITLGIWLSQRNQTTKLFEDS